MYNPPLTYTLRLKLRVNIFIVQFYNYSCNAQIVTHDADLEDAADNILRIEKEECNSFLVES